MAGSKGFQQLAPVDVTESLAFGSVLLDIAKARYGDTYEDEGQFMFGLLCDVVKAYVQCTEIKLIEAVTPEDCADVLGPVVANICPGYVVTDDIAVRFSDPRDAIEFVRTA